MELENSNPVLETARQTAKKMIAFSKLCKKNTPHGKIYKGIKGEIFNEKTNYPDVIFQWNTFGVRFKPVYEKKKRSKRQRS